MSMFGALGQMIGGGPKIQQQYYSQPVNNAIGGTANTVSTIQNQANSDIANYASQLGTASGQIQGMQPGQLAQMGAVTNNLATTTGANTFKNLGDYLTGKLNSFASGLAGQGAAGNNLALANSGYGGTGPSSYTTDVMMNRISSNLAPVFSNLMAGLGGDTATVMGQDRANAGAVQQAQDYSASIPLRTPGLALAPTQASLGVLSGLTGSLGGLAGAAKTNSAGFTSTPSNGMLLGNALGSMAPGGGTVGGNALTSLASMLI